MSPKLHVVTVASYLAPTIHYLLNSCVRQNLWPTLLGLGEPYPHHRCRIDQIRSYLDQLPEEDIVLFVDAFDVMIVKPEEELLNDFFSLGHPFVIAAEKNCWPHPQFHSLYPATPSPFRFLNAGGYMGVVSTIKEILNQLNHIHKERPYHGPCFCKYGSDDDQGLFTRAFLENPSAFHIDHACKLFISLFDVSEEELQIGAGQKLFCIPTRSYPGIIHANGPNNFSWLDKIAKKS